MNHAHGADGGQGRRVDANLALPPMNLMYLVTESTEVEWFLASGRRAVEDIERMLQRNGLAIERFRHVLDFGCGCGRVMRHWAGRRGPQFYGTDIHSETIAWCQAHLPFARFAVNGLAPPLPYSSGRFDFVYALSVFTHLPEGLQALWLRELRRVLQPGGYLLFTTHGAAFLPFMSLQEQQQFRSGRLVVQRPEVAGTNRCSVFHPLPYVLGTFARDWTVVDAMPEGSKGNPRQDLYLFRKPVETPDSQG